jgi:hypothetical protein
MADLPRAAAPGHPRPPRRQHDRHPSTAAHATARNRDDRRPARAHARRRRAGADGCPGSAAGDAPRRRAKDPILGVTGKQSTSAARPAALLGAIAAARHGAAHEHALARPQAGAAWLMTNGTEAGQLENERGREEREGIGGEGTIGALSPMVPMRLDFAHVLGARTLGALPGLERHGLPLAERVERLARRLMEEVLLARLVGYEAEALVRDDTLDGALG